VVARTVVFAGPVGGEVSLASRHQPLKEGRSLSPQAPAGGKGGLRMVDPGNPSFSCVKLFLAVESERAMGVLHGGELGLRSPDHVPRILDFDDLPPEPLPFSSSD